MLVGGRASSPGRARWAAVRPLPHSVDGCASFWGKCLFKYFVQV